jgi:rhomboid protease GluP
LESFVRWWSRFLTGGLDALISLLDALGARGVRWEWKKRAWKQALEERVAGWENLERGVRTRMKMCRACRTLVEDNPARCPSCGASLRGIEGGGAGRLLRMLLPSIGGSLSMALVSANVLMSLLLLALWGSEGGGGGMFGLLAPPLKALFLLGAKHAPSILSGEIWRLVTANFLHGGLIHLVFNSIALMNLGPLIEAAFGWRKLFVLYMTTGVSAFIVSTAVNPTSRILSVGASGAIFGLLGFAIVYGRYRAGPSARALSNQLLRWLMFMLFLFFIPQIDHAAHIGGLIPGAVMGLFLDPGEPKTPAGDRALWLATGIALLVTFGSFALMALAYPANLARLGS